MAPQFSRTTLKFLVPLPILAIGGALTLALAFTRPSAGTTDLDESGLLVETVTVTSADIPIHVPAQGTITPAQQIALQSQVGGRVIWQSDDMLPGGRFERGDPLVRIDGRDYRLAVSARAADVDRARLNLEVEEGRRTVAEQEWDRFGSAEDGGDPAELLARRGPHVRSARQSLRAAESTARRARLDLGRTTLRAPFNAMVVTENIDLGQLVGPASPLASLVGTDHFWVQVSVPVHQLEAITLPNQESQGGASVVVRQTSGESLIERQGRVIRLLPDLEPQGRMARLLIQVEDPLELERPPQERGTIPLLLGAYVEVEIAGRTLTNVISVPTAAIRNGDQVYSMSPDGRLGVHTVEIAWRLEGSVLISAGLDSGTSVIVSRVSAPIEGMRIRRPQDSAAPTAEQGDVANAAEATP